MLRYRRYRVFLVFAVIALFGLYQFGSQAPSVDYLKQQLNLRNNKQDYTTQEVLKSKPPQPQNPISGDVNSENPKVADHDAAAETKLVPPPVDEPVKPVQHAPPPTKTTEPKIVADGGAVKPAKQSLIPVRPEAGKESDGRVRVLPNPIPADSFEKIRPLIEQGEGRWEDDQLPPDAEPVFWEKPVEHFPLDDKNVIQLPTGAPKKLPKIQAEFEKETKEQKKDRLVKQGVIKEAFLHAWTGYKEMAWGHDEITPVTGHWKDPFNGWGATLVDTLDLLWMMDLKDEFEEAVEKVSNITFTTSRRSDIPLFETTIRYLGGLIGAYDVSGGKYRTLLDKAVELAEILIGAFDTPNRMPETFYQWKPTFASQAHRASTRVVLAELGSLSLEFTRLAQLTKEPRYYDAVARITDALEEWQDKTRVPGMWPSFVDASGCEKPVMVESSIEKITFNSDLNFLDEDGKSIFNPDKKGQELSPKEGTTANRDEDELQGTDIKKGRIPGWDDIHKSESNAQDSTPLDSTPKLPPPKKKGSDETEWEPIKRPDPLVFKVTEGNKEKRQLHDPDAKAAAEQGPADGLSLSTEKIATIPAQIPSHKHDGVPVSVTDWEEQPCLPQGLQSQAQWGTDDFTLGSMADSTYEYLPKMFLMLNGLVPQYKTMYEKAIDAAKEHLLFRVMIPDEKREVLVSGSYTVTRNFGNKPGTFKEKRILRTAGSHLTCFVGGMFALGGKLFDRKDDLQIAKKLTDGCVWAYGMTATGIMPETFHAVACDDRKNCPWNETKWWAELDPDMGEWREKNYESSMKYYRAEVAERESIMSTRKTKVAASLLADKAPQVMRTPEPATLRSHSDLEKRQLKNVDIDDVVAAKPGRSDYGKVKDEDYWTKAADAQDKYEELGIADRKKVLEAPTGTFDPDSETTWVPPTATEDEEALPPLYSPQKPPTHEEFVTTMIKEDRLPPGIQGIGDRSYILRPEALESVFYMHRLTGSPYWRRSGWTMISSILKHTRTVHANSAIDDTTKTNPQHTDSMESFWLAETLKYAWLLFEEEDRWSLDEWVFNTEAHPLRRLPGAGVPEGGVATKAG